MARLVDKTSTRQRIFTKLDTLAHLKRTQAVSVLMTEFDVSEAYARTLYQNHRKIRSETSGGVNFITIFKVRDTRSNSPVDPYMSSMVKNNPDDGEAKTKTDAIRQYRIDNIRKSKLSTALK